MSIEKKSKALKVIRVILIAAVAVFITGLLLPERYQMPCGTTNSYNHQSFWWHPWTRGVNGSPHTGVDIFGKEGIDVRPSVGGIVLYSGWFGDISGNMIVVLGPKWKLHEYIHMKESFVEPGQIVTHDTVIGLLGKTGNAAKTPAHVHYSIVTFVPHIGQYVRVYENNEQPQKYNWMKMFWLNPDDYLRRHE